MKHAALDKAATKVPSRRKAPAALGVVTCNMQRFARLWNQARSLYQASRARFSAKSSDPSSVPCHSRGPARETVPYPHYLESSGPSAVCS